MKKKNIILTGVILASCIFTASCKNGDVVEDTTTKTTDVTTTTDTITTTDVTTTSETTTTDVTTTEYEEDTFTLTFVSGCDIEVGAMTLKAGSAVASPQLSREGYQFKGWFTDEALTTPFKNKMPSKDLTVYASWEANRHIITFDMDGGEAISAIAVKYGEIITLPKVSDKDGYHFAGWNQEVPETMPDYDINLVAKWEKNSYTITFNANGGTLCESQTYLYDDEIIFPVTERKGYTFKEWGGEFSYTHMPPKNITFTAVWETINYEITYDSVGGTLTDSKTSYTIEDAFTLPVPVKEGYTFKCWIVEDGTEITDISKGTTGNLKLTAKYEINSHTFTYDYDNGADPVSVTYTYGEKISVPADSTKEGYTFAGWDKVIPDMMPDSDVSVKALWTLNSHTLTFKDGDVVLGSYKLDYGAEITKPSDPSKNGYTFTGWDAEIPELMPDSDITISAVFELITYTIDYELDGGTLSEYPTGYTVESPVDLLSLIPTKEDNAFLGWKDENGSIITSTEGECRNIKVTATWEIQKFKVTYSIINNKTNAALSADLNGNPESILKDNIAITLKSISLTDYEWGGWYSDSTFETPITEIPANLNKDITIYGYFKQKIHIIYELENGGQDIALTGYYGNPVTEPADPVKAGYVFTGWDADVTTFTDDVTVKATWGCMFAHSGSIITGVTSYMNGITSVTIPSEIDGVAITQIGDNQHCSIWESSYAASIKTIIVPDTVTTLYAFAFSNSKATSIIFESEQVTNEDNTVSYTGVTSIGNGAFSEASITSISIPAGVTELGDYMFQECTNLESVTFECDKLLDNTYRGVTEIGLSCFSRCTSLTDVTLPETLTTMGQNAFYGCTSLESIEIPDSLVSIGSYGFGNCTKLKSLSLPNGFYYSSNMLEGCTSLEKLSFYGNLNVLEGMDESNIYLKLYGLFTVSSESSSVDGMTECSTDDSSYPYAYIPTSLKKLEIHGDASGLEGFCYGMKTIETVTFTDNGTVAVNMFAYATNIKTINLGEGVTLQVNSEAFYSNTNVITLNYLGTKTEWKAYSDTHEGWDNGYNFTVICSDGTYGE